VVVLDTNVYLDVLRDADRGRVLAGLAESVDDTFAVSSVVVAELLVGLLSERDREELIAGVLRPIDDDRLITPAHGDWETAADALRHLGGDRVTVRRSFWNDLLIAASCARAGATLVTSNRDDFRRIRRAIPVRVVAAWE
jgi:predicted nucleic acid-binding protein